VVKEPHIENYLILDKLNHCFQFKIICDLPFFINKRFFIKINPWALKVLLLRGLKYPVIINYKYLNLIQNLSFFGHKTILPWH